jgi:4-carboxymuconolactone decarboxylase
LNHPTDSIILSPSSPDPVARLAASSVAPGRRGRIPPRPRTKAPVEKGHSLYGYYHSHHLERFPEIGKNAAALAEKFFAWYGAVFQEGTLTVREKNLIALAVAHSVQCPYCIDAYTTASLESGSDLEQMTEAIHVAAAIRGGASLVHGGQMREHAERKGM